MTCKYPRVVPVIKAGYKTTEFWLSVFAALSPFILPALPASTAAIVTAVSAAAYALSRGLAKR